MRLLKVPQANFAEMAHLDARTILTREGHTYPHPVRVWDFATDTVPAALTEADAEVARLVFRPGGAEFLRRHGLWSAGGLPDPAKAETVLRRPVAEAVRRLPSRGVGRVCAFAPDGATAAAAGYPAVAVWDLD